MTGIALRRHCFELAVGSALVAGVAVDSRVSTGQRETIVVLLDIFVGDLPSTDGMALLAIGTQLPAVHVSVTVLTALSHVGEDHLDVALCAGD